MPRVTRLLVVIWRTASVFGPSVRVLSCVCVCETIGRIFTKLHANVTPLLHISIYRYQ